MGFEQIGLQAIFEDRNFQAGIKRYQDGINTASSATERGASVMSRLGSVASGALVIGIGAATAAIGAFSAVAKIGIDAALARGEDLDKLGDMFGMNARQADVWATAMSHFQVPVEEAAYQLNFFTRGLAETTKVAADGKVTLTPFGESLKKLGVTAYDSKGRLKTLDQIMPQIMDKFAKLPPSVNKSNLAMELFGARGGSKMLDFLSAGSEALSDATKRIDQFGGMTDEQVTALETFGFALSDVGENLKKIWSQIGLAVLPMLRKFVDFINVRILPAFGQWVREYAPRITKSLQDFALVVQRDVLPVISRAWEAVQGFVQAFQRGGIGGFFDELGRQLGNAFKGFDLAASLGNIGGILSKALQDNWPKIQAELAKWGGRFWDWLTGKGGALEQAGTQLGKVISAVQSWLIANGPGFAAAFEVWKTQFWNWLTDEKNGVLVNIATSMEKLTEAIRVWSEDPKTRKQLESIGAEIANTIIDGIGNLFSGAQGQGRSDSTMARLAWSLYRATVNLKESFKNIGSSIAVSIADAIGARLLGPDVVNTLYVRLRDLMYAVARLFIFQDAGNLSRLIVDAFTKPSSSGFGGGGSTGGGNADQWGGTGEKYANGGFVRHTGLALVHAGEYVIPAPNVSNSRITNYNFNHNWPVAVPASARGWTEQMVRTVTHQEIISVLGKA